MKCQTQRKKKAFSASQNKMTPWTQEHLVFITTAYFTERRNIGKSQRCFEKKFQLKKFPLKKVINLCVKNFKESGNLANKKTNGNPRSATHRVNVLQSKEIVEKDPNLSVRYLAQQLEVSYSSARRILKKRLSMHPYKVQIFQQLYAGDFDRRVVFCE